MIDSASSWRIVELADGLRVVVSPEGTILGQTDAEPTAQLVTDTPAGTPDAATSSPDTAPDTSAATTTPAVGVDGLVAGVAGAVTGTVAAATGAVTDTVGAVATTVTSTVSTVVTAATQVVDDVVGIRFDTSGIGELSTRLKTAADGMRAALEKLDTEVAGLKASWDGSAREAYKTAHHEWNGHLRELNRILKDSSKLASDVQDTLVETESKIQDLWG